MATGDIDKLRDLFGSEGLPLPPLPEDLAPRISEIAPWVFDTRRDTPDLYGIDWFVEEACSYLLEDYLLVGQDGHGSNSWAIHYYLVHGSLALFLQCGWGGAYMDADQASRRMLARYQEAEHLLAAVDTARKAGRLPDPRRLVVVSSDFYGSRWAILSPAPHGEAHAIWQDDEPVIAHAIEALRTEQHA